MDGHFPPSGVAATLGGTPGGPIHDDTPIYHEVLDAYRREHRLADRLIEAGYADHYERHEGPIMFCDARACRAACTAA